MHMRMVSSFPTQDFATAKRSPIPPSLNIDSQYSSKRKEKKSEATRGGEAEENATDEIGEIVRSSTMDVHVFDARKQVIAEDEVDA